MTSNPRKTNNNQAPLLGSGVTFALDKLPKGGAVEIEEEITAENDPQAALKISMPQAGAEASAGNTQKYSKKVKLKVFKN